MLILLMLSPGSASTLCILCWKSAKAGESDFCSKPCKSLADIRAPFLIEIRRGHVAFEKGTSLLYFLYPQNDVHLTVAEVFTSEWLTSSSLVETRCPTIKRIYMVVMGKSFEKRFEKYRWVTTSVFQISNSKPNNLVTWSTKIGSRNGGIFHRKATLTQRWLVFNRVCGFGDPENLEPCSSNQCLPCSIVRSSFNLADFPGGITTSGLNR